MSARRWAVGRWAVGLASVLGLAVATTSCSVPGLSSLGKSKTPSRSVSVFHLRVGECLTPPSTVKAQISSLKIVSCSKPHTEEVFASFADHAGDNYPGATALEKYANAECLQRFAPYVGVAYQDSSLFYTYLLPSVGSWAQTDRTIVCFITTTGQPLTSSVKDSKR